MRVNKCVEGLLDSNDKILEERLRMAILLLLLLYCVFCNAQTSTKEIQLEINQNVETIAVVFELAEKGSSGWTSSNVQPLRMKVRQHFEPYKELRAVRMVDDFVERGFWLDALLDVVLACSQVPRAEIIYPIDESLCKRASGNEDVREGQKLINQFIPALNEFYRESKLGEFIENNRAEYECALNEVKKNLPDKNLIKTMEDYYGKTNKRYTLIPSPILYLGMGFGSRVHSQEGLEVFNVFAPLVFTQDLSQYKCGFDNAREIDELSVHEFGHSFVNPALELPENREAIAKYSYLFEPIRENMTRQGYDNWWTCFMEHVVRLGEIRIALMMGDTSRANRLRSHCIHDKKFIYLPDLEKSVKVYEGRRDQFASIDLYAPKLIQSLAAIDTAKILSGLRPGPLRKIIFRIVPEIMPDTSRIYITGNHKKLGDWNPRKVPLEKMPDGEWSKIFLIEENTHLEYKITRGAWDMEAVNKDGVVPANSILDVKNDTTITIVIENWKDKK